MDLDSYYYYSEDAIPEDSTSEDEDDITMKNYDGGDEIAMSFHAK